MAQNQARLKLSGKVVETSPKGIRLLLEDGRYGFIPEGEISYDRSVDPARIAFAPGEILQVIVLSDDDHYSGPTLSLRGLIDPWQAAASQKKYKVGQIVTGEIVEVRNIGAFVQLEPGIDAVLWPGAIPRANDQAIDDLLGVGDRVTGKISHVSYANHKLGISLINYLKDLSSLKPDEQAATIWDKFSIEAVSPEEQAETRLGVEGAAVPKTGKDDFIRQLGMQALSHQPLPDALQQILFRLCVKTKVDTGLVLEMDQSSRLIYVRATFPPMTKQEIDLLEDGLYHSAALQVTGGTEVIENDISVKEYKNFFPTLTFQSWMGVPIEIIGQEPKFGLILLAEDPLVFNERSEEGQEVINNARTASYFLSTVIQQDALLNYMQRYDERYGMGQIIGDMVHETDHEVHNFSQSLGALKAHIKNFPTENSIEQLKAWRQQLDHYIGNLDHCQAELTAITDSYGRQATANFEAVDVNEVVHKMIRQLKYTAKEMGIKIFTRLDPGVPPAFGITTHVKQVIYNVVLNGMQMIEIQREKISRYCAMVDQPGLLLQPSVIVIETRFHGPDVVRPIEVRICDSGPGIHHINQQRIFQNAYSERKQGEGRGLSISRNLAERMGGRLRLHDSVMYFGSAFSIELLRYTEKLEVQNG
jgi:signal transduction histidine kinase/predicted RNA-binding protein with RPS1 domain